MRKATLEGNITPKAKQRFLVEGFAGVDVMYITRDPIEVALGVIELPDQTRVPGGRVRSGEFTLTLQFARNQDRETYYQWFEMCKDDGGERGIDPTYKRDATLIYMRLFQGSPGTYNTGSNVPPVRARLTGVWPSQVILPDYDMNADEGEDGDLRLEVTMQFDSAELEAQTTQTQTAL